jgi:hypothetical protein
MMGVGTRPHLLLHVLITHCGLAGREKSLPELFPTFFLAICPHVTQGHQYVIRTTLVLIRHDIASPSPCFQ